MVSNVRSDLHAQALASLSAARSQNGAATLGRHASTEAVALGPLAGVRLIGALHYFSFQIYSNLEIIR